MKRLKCFISYYHDDDKKYVQKLREVYERIVVSDYSLDTDLTSNTSDEQIYENIKFRMNNCTITIILIGENTGRRKWVDWELWASLNPFISKNIDYRDTFRPNGILAIYLPGKRHCIPKRLQDNIDSGYVVKMHWNSTTNTKRLVSKLIQADERRRSISLIDNSRRKMKRNRYTISQYLVVHKLIIKEFRKWKSKLKTSL